MWLFARCVRVGRPLDDDDDTVSSELDSCSGFGMAGINSAGASKPFFVVVPDVAREPSEKRPLAFGADATRRINRVAFAPKAFGDSGPERDADGGVGGIKDICDASAVRGPPRDLPVMRCLSGLDFDRAFSFSSPSLIVSIPSPGCCEKYEGVLGVRNDEFLDGLPLLESVESEEWYDDRWSADAENPGASAWLGVKGVSVVNVASVAYRLVSSVRVEPLTSLLDDEFPSRSSDFQPDELGPGDGGSTGDVCSV